MFAQTYNQKKIGANAIVS